MATMKKTTKQKRTTKRPARAGATMPRELRAAYAEMRRGVAHLDASIADLRTGLLRAERRIELDARKRIRALRSEGRIHMKDLQVKQREAGRVLKQLSVAAGESWQEIKRTADSLLADARATTLRVGKRLGAALKS